MSQRSGREAGLVGEGAPVDPPPAPDVLRHLTRPDRERKGAKTRHLRRRRWPHGRHGQDRRPTDGFRCCRRARACEGCVTNGRGRSSGPCTRKGAEAGGKAAA